MLPGPLLLENAAWALGKLTYVPAPPVLVRLLGYSSLRIVRADSWALGEIASGSSEEPLRRAYGRWDDDELRQIIGGGLKKIVGRPLPPFR